MFFLYYICDLITTYNLKIYYRNIRKNNSNIKKYKIYEFLGVIIISSFDYQYKQMNMSDQYDVKYDKQRTFDNRT